VLQFDGISPKKRLAGRFVLKAKFGGFQFARSEKKKHSQIFIFGFQ
jgi:hypothetical protein